MRPGLTPGQARRPELRQQAALSLGPIQPLGMLNRIGDNPQLGNGVSPGKKSILRSW